jgi:hypothetical protein
MKLGLIAAVSTIAGALAFASFRTTPSTADAADACVRTDFKTEMVRDACKAGGQKAAKDAMKKFNKEKNIKSCNQCHTKLAPNYELKADAYDQFVKLGGKLIPGAGGGKGTGGGGGAGKGAGSGGGSAAPAPKK